MEQSDPGKNDSTVDFRFLISNSRYEQIEKELLKMFQQRHRKKFDNTKIQKCSHHHNHSLERSLFDIEEDLHKILLLLIKQLEVTSCGMVRKEISETVIKEKNYGTNQHYQNEVYDKKFLTNDSPNSKNFNSKNNNQDEQDRPESEYSKLCLESDERFRQKMYKIQKQSNDSTTEHKLNCMNLEGPIMVKRHQSNFLPKQQHSINQPNQSKQSLCVEINHLHKSNNNNPNTVLESKKTIRQIQNLIDELHLEHDWISKKLQHYQQQNRTILNQNRTWSQFVDKVNLNNMYTLSRHLIHIMDHLYELHQLNKKHLKMIIGDE